jgi:hypothetical protein
MRKLSLFMLLGVFLSTALGSNVKVVTTWKDPNIARPTFNKIAILFPNRDATLRERVENGLARRIRRAVAGHTFVLDSDLGNREALKERLASNQVDGLVLLRLLDVKEDTIVTLGSSASIYPSIWDVWVDPLTVSTASYAYTNRVITADLAIFSVETGKPVWIGRMKSTDAKYLKELLDDLVKAGTSELKKQKLI